MNEEEPITTAEEYASIEETKRALQCLTDADHAKLMVIARAFCAKGRLSAAEMEPKDLLHDAVVATIKTSEPRKRWNKRVSLIRHLDRAMENISGHFVRDATRRRKHIDEVPFQDGLGHRTERENSPVTNRTASSRLEEAEDADRVLDVLGDDHEAIDVLLLKAQGFKPRELQKRLGITKKTYETITKRIRRKFVKSEFNESETI